MPVNNDSAEKDLGMTGQGAVEEISTTLLHATGSAGVFARTRLFEQVAAGLSNLISEYREPAAEVLSFPPVMNRQILETSGYLESFPHLLGCVSCLEGTEAEIRSVVDKRDWSRNLAATALVLTPAACYPVYPMQAARGFLPEEGALYDVVCDCFRHEKTAEVGRLQSFRMREFVCLGSPGQVLNFRARWILQGQKLIEKLKLPYRIATASDPFFGRGGRLAASRQLEQALKFELLIPLNGLAESTACMSFNYHLDHFGATWNLRTRSGDIAHTSCVAFGMDRLVLAIFATHGLDPGRWPRSVREPLKLT